MSLGLLVLRVVVGLLFFGHGAQKLFGWFDGHGLRGTGAFFDQIGLKPGHVHAQAAGVLEFGGGILLILGLATPAGAAAIIAVMTAAIVAVHGPKGLWATEGGYEYNLVLAATAFAVASIGAGSVSLDGAFGLTDHGIGWALGALAVGIAGGYGAVWYGRRESRRRSSATTQSATTA